MNLNCTDASSLKKLLTRMLQQLDRVNGTHVPGRKDDSDTAYLYILLIMIFYACMAGGLILAYTRSRNQESKNDPYHIYIEREWGTSPKNIRAPEEGSHRSSVESEQLL